MNDTLHRTVTNTNKIKQIQVLLGFLSASVILQDECSRHFSKLTAVQSRLNPLELRSEVWSFHKLLCKGVSHMCIRKLSDITKGNTRMSVVCFGNSGVDLIELQILTRRVGKKVYIFLKGIFSTNIREV